MISNPHGTTKKLHAVEVSVGLDPRVIRTSQKYGCAQLILLIDGSMTINEQRQVQGPTLLWLPKATNIIQLGPGSNSCVLTIPTEQLLPLRLFDVDNTEGSLMPSFSLEVNLTHYPTLLKSAHRDLQSIIKEAQRSYAPSLTLIFAHMSIIWIHLWRQVRAEDMVRTEQQDPQGILQRFRLLLETHYREHWSISQYVEALGISNDRLYTCSKRETGLTPIQLVHERLVEESKLALERSDLNMEQIAAALGFRDGTHFSHFFKRITAYSPRQFRIMRRQATNLRQAVDSKDITHKPEKR